jgi:hypothetical protein
VASPPAAPEVGRAEPAQSGPSAPAAAAEVAQDEPVHAEEPDPAPPLATGPEPDLQRVRELWSAAVDAVTLENGMIGAAFGASQPVQLEGSKLTLAFKPDATFSKRKCEDNRPLLQTALRALTGHHVQIECECRELAETEAAPVNLSHDELVDRLKEQFAATEVFDDAAPTGEQS